MDINVTKTGDAVNLKISGELNIYCAVDFKARVMELLGECRVLEIDLEDVLEMDTSGVQLLVLVKREADALGKEFRLGACSVAAGSALALYNLKDFFSAA